MTTKCKPTLVCLLISAICLQLYPRCVFAADSEVRLGVILCLTSECAEWGQNSLNGVNLAVEEINSAGGVFGKRLVVETEDSAEASSGKGAVTAFRKLYSRGARLFIGPTWTPGSLALAAIASKMPDVVAVSPSVGVAEYNEAGPNLFAMYPHNEVGTRRLASYALDRGWKRAGIFTSEQPYEQRQANFFEDEFTKKGGEVSRRIDAMPEAQDLKLECVSMLKTKPEVVFLANTNRAGLTARQLRDLGYQGSFLMAEIDATRIADAQGALEGAITAAYAKPASAFVEKYRRRFEKEPGISSDTAYDTVYLYAKALEAAKSVTAQTLIPVMLQSDFDGASGRIRFDSKGGVTKQPKLIHVKGSSLSDLVE